VFTLLSLSLRRSAGVDGGFHKAVGLESQILTLGSFVRNDPTDFADCESLVVTSQAVGSGAGIVNAGTLSKTRSSSAAEVGGGEQLPLSLGRQSRQRAGIDDVHRSRASVSDPAVRASHRHTELTGHHGAIVAKDLGPQREQESAQEWYRHQQRRC